MSKRASFVAVFVAMITASASTAAIEMHGGKTFLHVKAAFDRPEQSDLMRYTQGVTARFSVELDSESGSDRSLHMASVW